MITFYDSPHSGRGSGDGLMLRGIEGFGFLVLTHRKSQYNVCLCSCWWLCMHHIVVFVCAGVGACVCVRVCAHVHVHVDVCAHKCSCICLFVMHLSIKILVNNYESWGMIKMSKEKASRSIYRV
jgi:hypothetical protein